MGFFQSEWSTILAIIGMGTLYLLVPVMGYDPARRGPMLSALWAMVLKIALGLFRSGLILVNLVMGNGSMRGGMNGGVLGDLQETVYLALPLAESLVFLGAMALFVYGLHRVRRREVMFRPPPQ